MGRLHSQSPVRVSFIHSSAVPEESVFRCSGACREPLVECEQEEQRAQHVWRSLIPCAAHAQLTVARAAPLSMVVVLIEELGDPEQSIAPSGVEHGCGALAPVDLTASRSPYPR
jgi:hypothetical protein